MSTQTTSTEKKAVKKVTISEVRKLFKVSELSDNLNAEITNLLKVKKPSQMLLKTLKTILILSSKEKRTAYENVRLSNALHKIESRTLSQLFKILKNAFNDTSTVESEILREILGKKTFVHFNTFKTFAKNDKLQFTYFDGLRMLSKCNVKEQINKKVARQNKATINKLMLAS